MVLFWSRNNTMRMVYIIPWIIPWNWGKGIIYIFFTFFVYIFPLFYMRGGNSRVSIIPHSTTIHDSNTTSGYSLQKKAFQVIGVSWTDNQRTNNIPSTFRRSIIFSRFCPFEYLYWISAEPRCTESSVCSYTCNTERSGVLQYQYLSWRCVPTQSQRQLKSQKHVWRGVKF